jgi:type IV pilus assembly protein PilA
MQLGRRTRLPAIGPSRRRSPASRGRGNAQRGFSMIELMITVAVVGILAALSIYGLDGYIARAHVADALMIVTRMKTVIAESFALDENADACAGIADITAPTGAVVSATCTDDGSVVTVNVLISEDTGNAVVDFVSSRSTGVIWQCVGDPTSAGYDNLPASCR